MKNETHRELVRIALENMVAAFTCLSEDLEMVLHVMNKTDSDLVDPPRFGGFEDGDIPWDE
mgnify:CR=1 FL=1